MLKYFPDQNRLPEQSKRDYLIALFTFITVTICLSADGYTTLLEQRLLGVCGWFFLGLWLIGENQFVRMQVLTAIMFATIGEHFASPFMGGYIYRFENVPAYVPPGHGLVYLTAVSLGRSRFFHQYALQIAAFVVISCGLWSTWGVFFAERSDQVGVVLYGVFLIFLIKGKSPMLYLAAFFITSWLELVGTTSGAWHWAVIDPASGLTQGNPPSGVAAWYCLVDTVALGGAPYLLKLQKTIKQQIILRKMHKGWE